MCLFTCPQEQPYRRRTQIYFFWWHKLSSSPSWWLRRECKEQGQCHMILSHKYVARIYIPSFWEQHVQDFLICSYSELIAANGVKLQKWDWCLCGLLDSWAPVALGGGKVPQLIFAVWNVFSRVCFTFVTWLLYLRPSCIMWNCGRISPLSSLFYNSWFYTSVSDPVLPAVESKCFCLMLKVLWVLCVGVYLVFFLFLVIPFGGFFCIRVG